MLTFDNASEVLRVPSIEDIVSASVKDCHEIGETNDTWIRCRRSTGRIEIVSKHTGAVVAGALIEDADGLGLSAAQIDAARKVTKL